MQKNINHKIQETFDSLEGMEKASVNPFFFTRLEARMNNEKNVWGRVSSFFARPVIAFACICFVIMVNTAVIFSAEKSDTGGIRQNQEIATVDEYSQVSSNLFEFVNTQP
ncbi:MAG TPA: hypothetical protein VIJ75_08395 [Hanamia sp.]